MRLPSLSYHGRFQEIILTESRVSFCKQLMALTFCCLLQTTMPPEATATLTRAVPTVAAVAAAAAAMQVICTLPTLSCSTSPACIVEIFDPLRTPATVLARRH